MGEERTLALISDLRALPAETPWVEFKVNNYRPDEIARLISALSNSARVADKAFAYIVWGIEDGTHDIISTTFEPSAAKGPGNQALEFWLSKEISPDLAFKFETCSHPTGRLVLLEIPAAQRVPTKFKDVPYIRIGDATPKLSDYPQREELLISKLRPFIWESAVSDAFLKEEDVIERLDYQSYFNLTKQPIPSENHLILRKLADDKIIEPDAGRRWKILNLGAVLFAREFSQFDSITRKAVRVVQYSGPSRISGSNPERVSTRGYAAGFEGLIKYLEKLLPVSEHIGKAFREEHPLYPSLAIRELVANMIIHQDFSISGTGPMIEIFSNHIEFTNPGASLIDPERVIDSTPQSRNETLASLMRRMNICEERGLGWDRVVASSEVFQLPAPELRIDGMSTRAILFAPRAFGSMTRAERQRACYQHAVLKHLSADRMTNSTLRARLGVKEENASQISGVIRDALDAGLIKKCDGWSARNGHYLPIWA